MKQEIDEDHIGSERAREHNCCGLFVRCTDREATVAKTSGCNAPQERIADSDQHSWCKLSIGFGHEWFFRQR